MRQYGGHNTSDGYHTNHGPMGCSQYDGHRVIFGQSVAAEMFLMSSTHIKNKHNIYALKMHLAQEITRR